MFSKFVPERSFYRLRDIKPELLHREGIRLLMLDFDNTIMAYTEHHEPDWVKPWLDSVRREGIQVVVITNSRKSKAHHFCGMWNVPVISRAKKPSPKALEKALQRFRVAREQCAMVGDQIFTDILAGNRAWVHAWLVKPINNHHIFLKARYALQKLILRIAKRGNGL